MLVGTGKGKAAESPPSERAEPIRSALLRMRLHSRCIAPGPACGGGWRGSCSLTDEDEQRADSAREL